MGIFTCFFWVIPVDEIHSSKWAALTKCSQDTAGRDIEALIAAHILRKGDAGGRSTWYALAN